MEAIKVKDTDDVPDAAERLLERIDHKGIIAFYGEMGAGKTTLIREICAQLGVTDVVNSPTFAIVNEYNAQDGEPIYHFDFYRINKTEEVYDFGYEEYFYSGNLCLIEWPEKIEEILPEEITKVYIRVDNNGTREITVG